MIDQVFGDSSAANLIILLTAVRAMMNVRKAVRITDNSRILLQARKLINWETNICCFGSRSYLSFFYFQFFTFFR